MNKNSLLRKIVYIAAIVLLLGPLFALGRPTNGLIGQLRTKYKMGQANLGKLDPTSESMRLATLGMKGIASTILWLRADYYKEEKYFDRFSATLNQIALMQPHFISVWQHQAHNLSYNVAPEFEDYRQRYEWIKKGIDYLVRGTKFNDRKPILQYDLGHYVGNKLGKADEHVQYRALYSKDGDFHRYFRDQGLVGIETTALGHDQKPDNWLTGKLWFEQAVALYEAGATIKKAPHLLLCYGPLWHMYYAEAIESEGVLDSSAQFAWKQAGNDWAEYGTKSLYQFRQGRDLTLLSVKSTNEEINTLQNRFDEITVAAKKKAEDFLRSGIPSAMLKVLEKPESELTDAERETFADVTKRITPSVQQIAAQLPVSQQLEGIELARKIIFAKEFLQQIESYRGQVNYQYWEVRAKAEQREDMVGARRLMYEADQLINVADVPGAIAAFEKSWELWNQVFTRYPGMITEEVGDDVMKAVGRYKRLVDEEPDENFILHKFLMYRRSKEDGDMGLETTNIVNEMNARAQQILDAESRGEEVPAIAPSATTETPKKESSKSEAAKVEPAKAEPAKAEPTKADSDAAKTEDSAKRPPTLENPDSQD